MTDNDKSNSLLQYNINYSCKIFYYTGTGLGFLSGGTSDKKSELKDEGSVL